MCLYRDGTRPPPDPCACLPTRQHSAMHALSVSQPRTANDPGNVCVVCATTLIMNDVQGLMSSDFVRFGPSPTTMYVGIHLDTWSKWSAVAIFTAISSFMNDLAGESLEPFFLMVLRDHKTRYIPYSKTTSIILNQAWTLYCSVMSVFGLYTYFAYVSTPNIPVNTLHAMPCPDCGSLQRVLI